MRDELTYHRRDVDQGHRDVRTPIQEGVGDHSISAANIEVVRPKGQLASDTIDHLADIYENRPVMLPDNSGVTAQEAAGDAAKRHDFRPPVRVSAADAASILDPALQASVRPFP